MKYFITYIICFFILSVINAQNSQTSWELSTTMSGNKEYVARDNIKLKPGFRYTATTGNSFIATINPSLLFPPGDNIYAKPDGTIVTSPSQGSVVGSLPGSIDVSPTGAATYTIPIECSPGINGMQPNIALVYNSQAGNGIAGWGWNLSGLSMITRATKNYYFNNEKTGIIWDSSSPLELDGQRLVASASGGMEYRLEHDQYDKIIGYDKTDWGPKYFEVHKKDGTILQYGNPSSINSYYPVRSSARSLPLSDFFNTGWALYKIKDRNNNYVEFTYITPSMTVSSGIYNFYDTRLASITYGHEEENANKQIVGRIDFTYDTNWISPYVYIDGMQTSNCSRLTKITVNGSDGKTLNSYSLSYKEEDNNYYLTSVKKANAEGESILPIDLTWTSHSYSQALSSNMSFETTPKLQALSDYTMSRFEKSFGDINGDGITDALVKVTMEKGKDKKHFWVVYRNGGNGWFYFVYEQDWDPDKEKTFAFADNDGDGKDELYVGKATASGTSYYYNLSCYKYNSSNVFARSSANDIKISITKTYYDKAKELYAIPADYLGNGKTQFILFAKNTKFVQFSGATVNVNIGGEEWSELYLTDINGNGKTELVYFYRSKAAAFFEYNKATNTFESIYTDNNFRNMNKMLVGDFNGDGNTDLLVKGKSTDKYAWKIWLSDGKKLIESSMADCLTKDVQFTRVTVMDINQDGKSDLIAAFPIWVNNAASEANMKVFINTGNGFVEKSSVKRSLSEVSFASSGKFNSSLTKNLFIYKQYYNDCKYHTFSQNVRFNKLQSIKTSLRQTYNITYGIAKSPFNNFVTTSEVDNSAASTISSFNVSSVLPPDFEIVKQITGPLMNQQYTFTTPLIHRQGKGFLGFKKVEVKDNIQGINTINEYELNNSYYVTYPLSTLIKTTGGTSISKTESKYEFTKRELSFSIRPTSQTHTDYLRNVTTKTEYSSYDENNNPQKIKITTGGNFLEIQDLKYESKGSWCKNKVTESKITRQRPGVADYVRTVQYTYDTKGNLLTKTVDPSDSKKKETKYSDYDNFGNPKKVTVTAGGESRSTTFTYSTDGRFVTKKVNNFLGETTTYTYDTGKALLLSETNRLGSTKYEYDGFGRLVKTISPDKTESVSVLRWASSGAPSGAKYYNYSEISGTSPVITWYDTYNREIQQEYYGLNSKKILVNTEYNSKGQIYRVSEPYFSGGTKKWSATNTYDSYGRLSKTVTPLGTTSYSYSGLTTTVTSPNSTTVTTANALNETIAQKTNGKKVDYEYYASGLIKKSTPEGGQPIEMKYDLQGNRTELKDPDAGTITNTYNAWGQVLTEKQAIHSSSSITTTYGYTKGMISSIARNGETTKYTYDSNNRLIEITVAGRHTQGFAYDSMDRMIKSTENIRNEKTYNTEILYDSFGRVMKTIYPSGYAVKKSYDSYGHLTSVTDDLGNICWQAIETNALGQYSKTKLGNKEVIYTYDSYNLPKTIVSSGIVNMTYSFNSKGNMEYREDGIYNQKETFGYDSMNRLTSWNIIRNGVTQKSNSISYNSTTGNINTKSDVGYTFNYGEGNNKPHALTSLSGRPTSIPTTPQTVAYTDFKKVKSITEGTKKLSIDYGVDEQRRKSLYTNGSAKLTRYYLGNYEEEINSSGKIRKIHYISGGNGLAAMYIQNDGKDTLHYAYTDYQGSLVALADKSGNVKERYAFDPWGNRRNPTYWYNTETRTNFITNRGYTLHEHLDEFRLINMNGRVYDPYMALFMSPDPYVQAPGNWVNYNRYLYCYGNPMSYTDPNGEFIWGIVLAGVINTAVKGFSGNLRGGGDFFKSFGIGVLSGTVGAGMSIGVSAALGTATTMSGSIVNGALTGAAGGFAAGAVAGVGNAWADGANFGQGLKAGLMSGLYSAGSGAIIGGVIGGVRYKKEMLIFQRGCEELGTTPNDAVPATDEFLSEAQKAWFPDAPMENVNKFTVENVPDRVMKELVANNAPGATKAIIPNDIYSGKSNVYFNKHLAFSSAKQLYFTMGHELIHVSQYAALAGSPTMGMKENFHNMLDYHAYSYQHSQGGTNLSSFSQDFVRQMRIQFVDIFDNMSFTKFPWTTTSSFKYPF